MFKELKILKLAIVLVVLVMYIVTFISKKQGYSFGLNRISFNSGEFIQIIPLRGMETPPEIELNRLGDDKLNKYAIVDKEMKLDNDGLYFSKVGDPILVKNNEPSEVIIVFPYVNNVLYRKHENKSYVSMLLPEYYLSKGSYSDELDKNVYDLLNSIGVNFSWISDFDLEKMDLSKTEMIVIYGKTKFYSQKMMDGLEEFVNAGGKLVLMTNDWAYYDFSLSHDEGVIIPVADENSIHTIESQLGFSSRFGGKSVTASLNTSKGEELKLVSDYWLGSKNKEKGLDVIYGSIATSSGTVYLGVKKNGLGEILNLGSECWLYDKNYTEKNIPTLKKWILEFRQ